MSDSPSNRTFRQSDPRAPSGWQIERAMSAWQRLRASLLDDPDLIADEAVIAAALTAAEAQDPRDLLDRLIDAAVWTRLRAEEADALADDMTARRDRYAQRLDWLKQTIEALMTELDIPKRRASLGQTYFGGATQSVVITDEQALADEYVRITREPNKTAIRADLDQGVVVEGAVLSNPHRPLVVRKL
jgi:hypothetical protein